jgi:uncharacterized protein (TIGR02996 family)
MPRKQTFSTQELGLLDAIHAEPRSNELRLIYADWLQDRGEPEYAELIALQCPEEPPADSAGYRRMLHLSKEFGKAWAGWTPPSFQYAFERGLPIAWLYPKRWTLDRLHALLAKISPRLRFAVMLTEQTLFHKQVGSAVFDHPIMKRVAKFHICPTRGRLGDNVAFVRRLAKFRLPPTAEAMTFTSLTATAAALARKIFSGRCEVTVQQREDDK